MFSPLLFDHKYDIDDIIKALCGNTHKGRWLLNTQEGTLLQEEADAQSNIKDGDNNNHWHEITPLPLAYIDELRQHEKLMLATAEEKKEIKTLLEEISQPSELLTLFDQGRAGGWVRERVKETALEWLDMKNMIPPSMRHAGMENLFSAPPAMQNIKIKIEN